MLLSSTFVLLSHYCILHHHPPLSPPTAHPSITLFIRSQSLPIHCFPSLFSLPDSHSLSRSPTLLPPSFPSSLRISERSTGSGGLLLRQCEPTSVYSDNRDLERAARLPRSIHGDFIKSILKTRVMWDQTPPWVFALTHPYLVLQTRAPCLHCIGDATQIPESTQACTGDNNHKILEKKGKKTAQHWDRDTQGPYKK